MEYSVIRKIKGLKIYNFLVKTLFCNDFKPCEKIFS